MKIISDKTRKSTIELVTLCIKIIIHIVKRLKKRKD